MIELLTALVRIPDVAYFSWDRLPGRRVPTEQVPAIAPDLAVEVLSPGNTAAEMDRKLGEYFQAGVRLAWLFDLRSRTCAVYGGPGQEVSLTNADTVEGEPVLPGCRLSLAELFAELDEIGDRVP